MGGAGLSLDGRGLFSDGRGTLIRWEGLFLDGRGLSSDGRRLSLGVRGLYFLDRRRLSVDGREGGREGTFTYTASSLPRTATFRAFQWPIPVLASLVARRSTPDITIPYGLQRRQTLPSCCTCSQVDSEKTKTARALNTIISELCTLPVELDFQKIDNEA